MVVPTPPSTLQTPIQFVKGVGPKRAPLLEKLGIKTVEDAFWNIPWRYDNRVEILPIRHLIPGSKATIRGTVQGCRVTVTSRRKLVLVRVTVRDGTGVVECLFFNQPFLKHTFTPGVRVLLTGDVTWTVKRVPTVMMKAPVYELLDDEDSADGEVGKIVPIYHETQGITSNQIRRIVRGILDHHLSTVVEVIPQAIRCSLALPPLDEALAGLHCPSPDSPVDLLNAFGTAAHRRLAFEELLLLQLALGLRRKHTMRHGEGIPFQTGNSLVRRFQAGLPFSLTAAQERAIAEIEEEMGKPRAMNRLLQGDVGCGKTIVALHAMITACGSGYQTALMAPTEVLSEQHFRSVLPYAEQLGLECLLVKGGQPGKVREGNLARIRSGTAQMVVGTHALLQPEVQFHQLGLVIVDEQHKFGVLQRAKLREKAVRQPDVLVMTATPIPRTLAMTLYGDLDVSVIDQFPPGKKPVITKLFMRSQRRTVYELLRKELEAGRQGYVVFPLVEPSEKVDLHAAVKEAERLGAQFPGYPVGVLHGRLSSRDKQQVMEAFQRHEIRILVSTTVVEVGLDVHQATVMVIEHAERFGLAQLHQLRGRVGRGGHQGYCFLIHGLGNLDAVPLSSALPFQDKPRASGTGKEWPMMTPDLNRSLARQRLRVFAGCHDGFALAEEDLKIRGPGQVLGVQQWGELNFRVADLARDVGLLTRAKEVAWDLLNGDPELQNPEHLGLREKLFKQWGEKFSLGAIG